MNFVDFMSGWGWAIFSLIASVFSAGYYLVNQYLKQPGYLLVFWIRVLVILFMLPLVSRLELPLDWRFYAAVLLSVIAGTFSDILMFDVSAKYGGGVVARVQPITVWGAFLLWFLFKPELLGEYAAHPLNTFGILLALGGCVYFSMRLNKCHITKSAMRDMAPALLGYTFTTVLNKYAMDHGTTAAGKLEGAVYGYMFFQSAFAVILIGAYAALRAKRDATQMTGWIGKPMLAATLLGGFSWICHMIYKNYSMAFVPNPSDQGAILLTAPVFIAGFYHLTKHKEEADVKSGMGIVACALLLALLTVH